MGTGTKIAEKLSFKLSRDLKADEIVFRWCLTGVYNTDGSLPHCYIRFLIEKLETNQDQRMARCRRKDNLGRKSNCNVNVVMVLFQV